MTLSFRTKLLIGFVLLLVILGFFGWKLHQVTEESDQDSRLLTETHEVLQSLEQILSTMVDIETGERGYVITSNQEFLRPLQSGTERIGKLITQFRPLTVDNPILQRNLDTLEILVKSKIDFSNEVVQALKIIGIEAAAEKVRSGTGNQGMDRIRSVIETMKAEENRLLVSRRKAVGADASATTFMLYASLTLVFAFTLLLFLSIQRYPLALEKSKIELERQVKGQTSTLVASNEKLRSEVAERKSAQDTLHRNESMLNETGRMAKVGGWELGMQTMTLIWTLETYRIHEVDPSVKPDLESAINFYAPEARPIITEAVDRCIHEGKPWDLELPFITATGKHIWVRAQGQAEFRDGKYLRLFGAFQDITERKRAEQVLQQSEKKYRDLFEQSDDATLIIRDGGFVDCNQATVRMLRYRDKQEFMRTHPSALSPERQPDGRPSREKADEMMKIALEKGSHRFEWDHRKADGEVFPVEVLLTAVVTESENKVLHTVWRDISQRKREEKLRETIFRIAEAASHGTSLDDLFVSIHRSINDVMPAQNFYIALYDENKDLLSFPYFVDEVDNPSPPKKLGKGLTEYVLRTGRPILCDTVMNDELMRRGEVDLIGAPSPIWLGVPLMINDKVSGVMAVQHYTDEKVYSEREKEMLGYVSSQVAKAIERKRAEEAQRKSEEQFRLISENVVDLIAVLDLEGKRLYNSPSYKPILGDLESLRGTDSFQEIHPEDREKIRQIFQETVKTGIAQRAEYRFMLKDGSIRFIESQGSVIRDEQGNVVRVVVVSRDVTEKKQLEKQFLRAQRMESIGTLAGGIAHDLNNVLAPILLALNIISKKLTDEQSQKMLQMLESTAKRGSDLIRQVLSFARGVEGERTIVQLRHLVDEIGKIINETFPKSISLRTDIPKTLPTISADATQLHQVLMNLCVNARDAMPNGGKLEIKAETIALDEQYVRMHVEARPGPHVVITVTDQGMGIPPAVMERIFEPFFTTKEIGKGTGLGLSTVLSIIKSHDGFVNVYSEVGKGTTFKIYLPAQEGAQAAVTEEKEKLPAGNGELILVVDDEESIREITKATLEAYGYSIITCSDGTEAVAAYATHGQKVALVLTDMLMPYMDGAATIRAIQKLNPKVKVLAVSGLKQNGDMVTQETVMFLHKPYTSEKLLKTIGELLDKK